MIYIEHFPTKKLSHLIEKIWYCRADEVSSVNLTIPLLNHELVFNFSQNYRVRKANEEHFRLENPLTWLNGLQSEAYYAYSNGRHEMIGILFTPMGLRAFTKFDSRDFADDFIDPVLIFGKSFQTLGVRIQETSNVKNKLLLIENFFTGQMNETRLPPYLVPSMQRLSTSFGSRGCVAHVCDQVSVTNKSLIAAFNKYVGINPTRFARLQTVNRAIKRLSREPMQSLTGLTYDLEFYDQPHFSNLFKLVTSLTPSQYAAMVIGRKVELDSPNFVTLQG